MQKRISRIEKRIDYLKKKYKEWDDDIGLKMLDRNYGSKCISEIGKLNEELKQLKKSCKQQ